MVKNKAGGSRHKKMARKNVKDYGVTIKTRFPSNDEEMIARVVKKNGQGTCEVLCNDNVKRLCYIRQKFSGRNKRDNFINVDTMVLVGKRAWATEQKKKLQKVDLLYVYSNSQIDQIKQSKGFNNEILPESEKPLDNPYDFTDDEEEEENQKNEKIKPTKMTNTKHTTHNTHTTHTTKKVETFDDLDFDDI
jgi:translation initiation factor IF-1